MYKNISIMSSELELLEEHAELLERIIKLEQALDEREKSQIPD